MENINDLSATGQEESPPPLFFSDEAPFLLRESDIIAPDYPTEAETDEGRQWLSNLSFGDRMAKAAILYGWQTGIIKSPIEAVQQLIEAKVFPWATVMDMLVTHARAVEIVEGEAS